MRRWLLALVLWPAAAESQVITGRVAGTVVDETGGVLPNATATLSSSAIIGGRLSRTTNDSGQFRFVALAPGLYDLRVELAGFRPYVRVDGAFYGQPPALAASPIAIPCFCPAGESGYVRDAYYDAAIQIGGPLARERAWFYGSFRYFVDAANQPGGDPRFAAELEVPVFFAKINWQLSPSVHWLSSAQVDDFSNRQAPSAALPFESTWVELLVDVFNVFDESAAEQLVTPNAESFLFELGRAFVDPRRVMLGVKIAF